MDTLCNIPDMTLSTDLVDNAMVAASLINEPLSVDLQMLAADHQSFVLNSEPALACFSDDIVELLSMPSSIDLPSASAASPS
jgi:hypothetical protein